MESAPTPPPAPASTRPPASLPPPDVATLAAATHILRTRQVAVMVVAYDAARHIRDLLARIPAEVLPLLAEVFVLDDASRDDTYERALAAGYEVGMANLRVFRTPVNRGYGGNQKVGYTYAIERGFDFVVMLHGDGQYPPEHLPSLIAAFADEQVEVVLGSRMLHPRDALRGGMPFYKWVGNQVLTGFENRVLGVDLAEFHTGYRAYRVATLARIPFRYGSDTFHFDTEILIQFLSAGCRIVEVPIPTRYGDEVCHVNGLRYAWDCARSVIEYRLFNMGLFYNPLLDFQLFETENYFFKRSPNTLHQHVVGRGYEGEDVLDLGAASGYLSAEVARQARRVVAVDRAAPRHAGAAQALAVDVEGEFDRVLDGRQFDTVLALDVLEHLSSPEEAAKRIARLLKPGGRLIASTGNISFFVTRAMLLLGSFNYGKRGILDFTHKRLFTLSSFLHLFRTYGFAVEEVRGFGPPIRDLISARFPFSWIDGAIAFLARHLPRLFAYQFLVVARRLPSLEEVYAATRASGASADQLEAGRQAGPIRLEAGRQAGPIRLEAGRQAGPIRDDAISPLPTAGSRAERPVP